MKLFPYQQTGAEFLAARRFAFLADGMGLGKTAQAIVACNMVGASNIVVLCPAIAKVNWLREFDLWGRRENVSLKVVSYDRLAVNKAERDAVRKLAPDVLILDEAHYLKTRTAKRTIALYGAHCYGNGVASTAARVWLLSGTPCPNHAGEMWPHLRTLWPELIKLGGAPRTYINFIQRYCILDDSPFGPRIVGNRNAVELRAILRQFMLRRRAEDVLKDLPPMFWQSVPIEPDAVLADIAALEADPAVTSLKESLTSDGDIERAAVALASLRRVTGLAKANLAGRMIGDELQAKAYNKVVVFFQHLDVGKSLVEYLSQYGVVSISGSTTMTQRQHAIDQFQANPDVRVFIGQLQACSTAITLHASNQVVFVEQSWTPSDNAQAAARCHRIGQSKPVFVRMLGLAKSIDEAVARVLARKSQAISELMRI